MRTVKNTENELLRFVTRIFPGRRITNKYKQVKGLRYSIKLRTMPRLVGSCLPSAGKNLLNTGDFRKFQEQTYYIKASLSRKFKAIYRLICVCLYIIFLLTLSKIYSRIASRNDLPQSTVTTN